MFGLQCVAATGMQGVPVCKSRGNHLPTCDGETCRGCLPSPAEVGFLCQKHFEFVDHAYRTWPGFKADLLRLDGAPDVANTGGVQVSRFGHVNLSTVFLTITEVEKYLASAAGNRTVELWVSTEGGARDAVWFHAAARAAGGRFELTETVARKRHVECPECGADLWVVFPPDRFRGERLFECDSCHAVAGMDEIEGIYE